METSLVLRRYQSSPVVLGVSDYAAWIPEWPLNYLREVAFMTRLVPLTFLFGIGAATPVLVVRTRGIVALMCAALAPVVRDRKASTRR